jgi:type I restriction enzyme, S subunit
MASEWPVVAVGDLCDQNIATIQTGPFGSQLHAHEYRPVGTPVVPTEAIGRRRIIDENLPRVDGDVAERLARHRLRVGDILFARRGAQATGSSAIVEKNLEGALCGTGAILMRVCEPNTLDPTYLSFALASPLAMQWLRDHAVGAVMPNLNADIIRRLELPLPPLAEQRMIARILKAFDDRIELNRKMNTTLETMARALFKSWFVDFDPVRAKAEGRTPVGMDAATADLFPDELVASELGRIPRGWRPTRWGAIASLEYGRALRGYGNETGNIPVWGTNGQIGWHTTALCPHPGIIVGRKGAYRGIHFSPTPFFVIDTAFFMRSLEEISWRWAFYELQRFDLDGMDSGSAIPSTSRDQFYGIPVCTPPLALQQRFETTMSAAWSTQDHNTLECRTLDRVRDDLLPRMLSGELSVDGAEREAVAAL